MRVAARGGSGRTQRMRACVGQVGSATASNNIIEVGGSITMRAISFYLQLFSNVVQLLHKIVCVAINATFYEVNKY